MNNKGKTLKWALAAVFVGNALEWFDLVIFGYFAAIFAKLFFPTESNAAALSFAFGAFGVTFLFRPIGAVVIGAYADRHGRKAALLLSAALMTIGTTIIAVLPTYAAIGLAAPSLLIFARIIQGISAGGEFGSVTTFLAEQDAKRRGFFASWQFSSQGLTALLATLFGVLLANFLSPADLENWGWRVPFVFGMLLGPIAYLIRLYAIETPEFRPAQSPLRQFASDGWTRALISISAVTLGTVVTYTIIFLPTYTRIYLGFTTQQGFIGGLLTASILITVTPLAGALSDRYGRLILMAIPAALIFFAGPPSFGWLAANPTFERLLVVQAAVGLFGACYLGALPALMSELFPASYRTTGLSVSYALGVTCFGGFAPLINTWLIEATGSVLAPSFYLTCAAGISLAGLGVARRFGIK